MSIWTRVSWNVVAYATPQFTYESDKVFTLCFVSLWTSVRQIVYRNSLCPCGYDSHATLKVCQMKILTRGRKHFSCATSQLEHCRRTFSTVFHLEGLECARKTLYYAPRVHSNTWKTFLNFSTHQYGYMSHELSYHVLAVIWASYQKQFCSMCHMAHFT